MKHNIESHFIFHNNSALHYIKAGAQKTPLLFFHGFGQDHSMYVSLIQSLGRHYQLYIFDLYFHGNSTWGRGEDPLTKDEWEQTIAVFLQRHEIDRFSLAGFSMGGKFAIATLERFASRVDKVWLIAPDGINTSFWYSLATYPLLFRRFFKSMITNYGRFERLANTLSKMNLVDRGLVRFADYQMGSEAKRTRVYYSWVVFRRLKFDLKKIAALINDNGIILTIIVGKFDKVIRPGNMERLLKHVKNYRFRELNSGHSGLVFDGLHHIVPDQ